MTERRKFMRFNAILDVIYNSLGRAAQKNKSHLKDLSKEGLKLSGDDVLQRGSRVELEMKIPGDNIPVFAFGEVAWSEKAGSSGFESGIRFTEIKKYDRARLLDYVYNEWIKTKRDKKEF